MDGAACVLDYAAVSGLLLERYAEDVLVTITAVELNARAGAMLRLRGCFGLGRAPEERWVTVGEAFNGATVLGRREEVQARVPAAGWRSCLRCRRISAGPCPSATCEDLQALTPGLPC